MASGFLRLGNSGSTNTSTSTSRWWWWFHVGENYVALCCSFMMAGCEGDAQHLWWLSRFFHYGILSGFFRSKIPSGSFCRHFGGLNWMRFPIWILYGILYGILSGFFWRIALEFYQDRCSNLDSLWDSFSGFFQDSLKKWAHWWP